MVLADGSVREVAVHAANPGTAAVSAARLIALFGVTAVQRPGRRSFVYVDAAGTVHGKVRIDG